MSDETQRRTVGALPSGIGQQAPSTPKVLTRAVWLLWGLSLAALVSHAVAGWSPAVGDLVAVDGLTVLMWTVVTFFSGIVHSYSRRYMAGSKHETRFFATVFGFTVVVMALVAANHIALFGALWLAMGLLMASLIGVISGWEQAQAAAAVARKYFLASSALLGVALMALWSTTGATTISGIGAASGTLGGPVWLLAASALILAAMIQSALIPFQGWLLSSMTAPTPASALMHAGFVNAGGVLLIGISTVVAGQWLQRVASGGVTDPVSLAILAFAAVLGAAMLGLGGLSVRNWLADDAEPTVAAD